jgi:hypothetical protein
VRSEGFKMEALILYYYTNMGLRRACMLTRSLKIKQLLDPVVPENALWVVLLGHRDKLRRLRVECPHALLGHVAWREEFPPVGAGVERRQGDLQLCEQMLPLKSVCWRQYIIKKHSITVFEK